MKQISSLALRLTDEIRVASFSYDIFRSDVDKQNRLTLLLKSEGGGKQAYPDD